MWGTPLSWTDVKGQIDSGKPFMFVWAWNGGGDIEIVSYSKFVGGPGYDHTHGADIYNIKHQ